MAEETFADFIQDHLTELTRGTHISPELLIQLYSIRLLTESEQDILVKQNFLFNFTEQRNYMHRFFV